MKSPLLLSLLLASIAAADEPNAKLSPPEISPSGLLIMTNVENLTKQPLYTEFPSAIILEHKQDGKWVRSPNPPLSHYIHNGEWIAIPPGKTQGVGVALRDYRPLIHSQYRLIVMFYSPDGQKITATAVSPPADIRTLDPEAH